MKDKQRYFVVTIYIGTQEGTSVILNLRIVRNAYPRFKDITELSTQSVPDALIVTVMNIMELTEEDYNDFWDGLEEEQRDDEWDDLI